MKNLLEVDWSTIPAPINDGATNHLIGRALPNIQLPSTNQRVIDLSTLKGRVVVYAYPRTGRPGTPSLEGWDMIPGAKGCTPQSCSFRDHFIELTQLGVSHVFGFSTQDTAYQAEVVERLHLPFPILSDEKFTLANALNFPTFEASGVKLLKRFTMIIQDGTIEHVLYPVFPPDNDAENVINWLKAHPNLHPEHEDMESMPKKTLKSKM